MARADAILAAVQHVQWAGRRLMRSSYDATDNESRASAQGPNVSPHIPSEWQVDLARRGILDEEALEIAWFETLQRLWGRDLSR